jgi:hypothetical protein
MNKLILTIIALASVSFAFDLNDGRAEEVQMFTLPQKTVEITHEEKELDIVPPSVKRIEIKEVSSLETPFQQVAWENNRTMREEMGAEIVLGIGF